MALLVPPAAAQPADFPGWPLEWKGVKLRRAPLTQADRACVARFSGVSARLTEQNRSFLFRWTRRPTSTLLSVRECYARAGYHVAPESSAASDQSWSCFIAAKTGERLLLCETVYSDSGRKWAKVDEWLEQSINDRLSGPFWSVVTSKPARR